MGALFLKRHDALLQSSKTFYDAYERFSSASSISISNPSSSLEGFLQFMVNASILLLCFPGIKSESYTSRMVDFFASICGIIICSALEIRVDKNSNAVRKSNSLDNF